MKTTMPDDLVRDLVKPSEAALDALVELTKTEHGSFDQLVAGLYLGMVKDEREDLLIRMSVILALAVRRLASVEENGVPK